MKFDDALVEKILKKFDNYSNEVEIWTDLNSHVQKNFVELLLKSIFNWQHIETAPLSQSGVA